MNFHKVDTLIVVIIRILVLLLFQKHFALDPSSHFHVSQ